ncbi:MAG: MerR family transcriptional regulator [Phycisphaerae bacterium]|jgi:hypothetical protein|nr:MerR family transcriptional regulator [Phycisphaerae bacterium]
MHSKAFKKHDATNVAEAVGIADTATTVGASATVGIAGIDDVADVASGVGAENSTGCESVGSPQVSTQVSRRCGQVVGKRRGLMVLGRVDDSGEKMQASTTGPVGEESSTDGGSQSVGIGQRFTESKPIGIPPKQYRIGEIVEHSGLSRQTIHNYTTMGLLVEVRRTDGGHRLYDESVFERLNGIMALKAQHKSLAYIRKYYAGSGDG